MRGFRKVSLPLILPDPEASSGLTHAQAEPGVAEPGERVSPVAAAAVTVDARVAPLRRLVGSAGEVAEPSARSAVRRVRLQRFRKRRAVVGVESFPANSAVRAAKLESGAATETAGSAPGCKAAWYKRLQSFKTGLHYGDYCSKLEPF